MSEDKSEQLYNILSEYMECCVLVGYDMDGKRTVINHWREDQSIQRDALVTLMKDSLIDFKRPEPVTPIETGGDDDFIFETE